jgi:hypothetical protein
VKDTATIFRDALQLPLAERERLVVELVESLGFESPPGALSDGELARKISERLADLDAGRARLIDSGEAIARGRANLRRRLRP